MKILILFVLVLSMSQVFASKSRMEALGQINWGSHYIDNNRLTFINPANIVDHNNYVIAEWGDQNITGSDSEGSENGEGGVFIKGKNYVYGVHLGNETDDAYLMRAMSGVSSVIRPMLNRVDIFLGKDMGVKVGAGIWFALGNDEQTLDGGELKQHSLGIKLGVKGKNYRLGIVQGLLEKSEGMNSDAIGSKGEFKGTFMTMINGGYDISDNLTIMGEFIKVSAEVKKTNSLDGKLSLDSNFFGVGYKIHKSNKVKVWSDLTVKYFHLDWDKVSHRTQVQNIIGNLDTALAASGRAGTQFYAPLNIAAEVQARDWLVFRGSITQRLWGFDKEVGGAKITKKQGRTVSAGIGFKFDNLNIDGLVKSRDSATLGTNDMISRVAATYYW